MVRNIEVRFCDTCGCKVKSYFAFETEDLCYKCFLKLPSGDYGPFTLVRFPREEIFVAMKNEIIDGDDSCVACEHNGSESCDPRTCTR